MKIFYLQMLLCLLFLAGSCENDESSANDNTVAAGESFLNVAYASNSSAQKLDIYLPEGDGPFPVVVLIHGGAFKMGDKSMETSNAAFLVSKGYAAACINYRLSGEAIFPAQIQDCKAAVRFLKANSSQYKLNPEKVASWGSSAGGNLSALLGTTAGAEELEGAEPGNSSFSSAVVASVAWFGPMNFSTMDAEAAALGFSLNTNAASSPESQLMGAAIPTIPEQVQKANPASYISAGDAAFFIQAGDADRNIPYTQISNFYQALLPVLGENAVSYELLAGAGHGGSQFSSASNLGKVIAFFDKHLK